MMQGQLQRKRRASAPHEDEGTWAISYGDMITLLLGFFVLFFSMDYKSTKESQLHHSLLSNLKLEQASLRDSFSELGYETIELEQGKVLIFFKGQSFFESGQTSLTDEVVPLISSFVERYLPFAGTHKLKVFSFTDDKPVSKWRPYKDNLELSVLRSLSVVRLLESKGIPADLMEVAGRGVMSAKLREKLAISTEEKSKERALSRTVAFIVSRGSL